MKYFLGITLVLIACLHGGAQEVISTTGGFIESSEGSVSWTIGEPIIMTEGSGNNLVTQGFQQPQLARAIPTIDQWGMIILLLLISCFSVLIIKEKSNGNYKSIHCDL